MRGPASGGREAAIAWACRRHGHDVTVAPDLDAVDLDAVDLVIPGPEAALVAGAADRCASAGVPCFGPVAALAELEASKGFARHLAAPFLPATGTPSTEDLVELVRSHTQTLYHPVGTCAMGSGERAVVDPELRVRGVDGLRVADASVMPEVTRGNTNAPTVMIGEKCADLIKESR